MGNINRECICNQVRIIKNRMEDIKENLKWISNDLKIIEGIAKSKEKK